MARVHFICVMQKIFGINFKSLQHTGMLSQSMVFTGSGLRLCLVKAGMEITATLTCYSIWQK